MKTLLLIPSIIKTDIEAEVAAGPSSNNGLSCSGCRSA